MYKGSNGLRSNRWSDSIRENNMKNALDKIYEKNGYETQRVEDRDRQIAGIDLYMKLPEGWAKVDEKAATSIPAAYMTLTTFSFEIASNNNPNRDGWLFKPESETTHYAIVYPLSNDNFKSLQAAEIMILDKQKVKDYLWDLGIGSKKDAEELLDMNGWKDRKGRDCYVINDAVKLMRSNQLAEQPVNAIIDKGVLRRMADHVINHEPQPDKGRFKVLDTRQQSRDEFKFG